MASVEELLAKYGGTESLAETMVHTPDREPGAEYQYATDNNTTPQEETSGSTSIMLGNNQDHESSSLEQDITNEIRNSDGRRLVADAYYSSNQEDPETTTFTTVPGFEFEDDDEEEFPVGSSIKVGADEGSFANTSVQYRNNNSDSEYSTPANNLDLDLDFSDNDSDDDLDQNQSGDYYVESYRQQTPDYPEVYVDPTAPAPAVQQSYYQDTDGVEVAQHESQTPTPDQNNSFVEQLSTLMPAPAKTHAGLAAFSTFMFPPFGAVAVHHAMNTFIAAYNGEADKSATHSSKALSWSIASIIAGSIFLTLIVAYKVDPTLFDALFNKIGLLNND